MNYNEIEIDIGKYINWAPVEEEVSLFNIDSLLSNTKELWLTLETRCLASCCGLHAFDFTYIHLQYLLENKPELFSSENFNQIKHALITIEEPACESHILNSIFYKKMFIELLEHINTCMLKSEKLIV